MSNVALIGFPDSSDIRADTGLKSIGDPQRMLFPAAIERTKGFMNLEPRSMHRDPLISDPSAGSLIQGATGELTTEALTIGVSLGLAERLTRLFGEDAGDSLVEELLPSAAKRPAKQEDEDEDEDEEDDDDVEDDEEEADEEEDEDEEEEDDDEEEEDDDDEEFDDPDSGFDDDDDDDDEEEFDDDE